MRSIKDNCYIFLSGRGCFGEVIAERSRFSNEAVGKNIFEYLKMEDSEIAFLKSRLKVSGQDVICAACKRKGDRAVLFFNFLDKATSICLAVVPDAPIGRVAIEILDVGMPGIVASPGVVAAAEASVPNPIVADKETSLYLSGIVGQIMKASRLANKQLCDPSEDIREVVLAMGDFIGAEVEFETRFDPRHVFGSIYEVFDGRTCAAMLLLLTATARAYSTDRCLRVVATRGVSGCILGFSFQIFCDGWQRAVSYLAEGVNGRRNLPMVVDANETDLKISVIPYYEDEGLLGAKENNVRFDLAAYEELFL